MNVSNTTGRDPFLLVRDPMAPPAGLAKAVVAIGNFDGVHRGHAAVIERARSLAGRLGRPCAVLTFEPHPADFFAGRAVIFRLTPEPAKARVLAGLGLDGVIVLTFDATLASLDAEAFVAEILVGRLDVAAAVVGYDFHFGRGRQGSPAFLAEAGERHGFAVEIVEPVKADAAGSLQAVSSTETRAALARGDVALASRLLGHSWFVIATVVAGKRLGRTLGFPTVNLELEPPCALAFGIYAVFLRVDGRCHAGVASYGRRPTFDDGAPLLEVHVFDFDGDLYGKRVEVTFVDWIRGEAKFASAAALTVQMQQDAAAARRILAR
jgi:riboflavin kinase/FMN adenylyltransferase